MTYMDEYTEKDYIKVALMYYEEGMTQAEIARKFGVSRSLISKILIDSRKANIVEIIINSQSAFTAQLEREMEKTYQLQDVVIVDTNGLDALEVKRKVGHAAANYISGFIKREGVTKIGISWGETLRSVINAYPYSNHPDLDIYPLIGGMGNEHFQLHSNQLVHELAEKLRAKSHYLYVPALVSNKSLRQELEKDVTISRVLSEAETVDVALLGIAAVNSNNTMIKTGYITLADQEAFKKEGIIGDINSRFFDKNGVEHACQMNQRVIGVNLDKIKQIKHRLAVAYGLDKAEPLRVALEEKLVTALITTDQTAQAILGLDSSPT